jgi:hypothetical protein
MAGAWSDIGGLGTIRVLWLTWLTGWLGVFLFHLERVRGPDSVSA